MLSGEKKRNWGRLGETVPTFTPTLRHLHRCVAAGAKGHVCTFEKLVEVRFLFNAILDGVAMRRRRVTLDHLLPDFLLTSAARRLFGKLLHFIQGGLTD